MKRSILAVALALTLSPWPAALAAAEATALTGFVDASYFHDDLAQAGAFGLDQVEIDVVHQASEMSLVRADLEWIKDGDGFLAQVEQAFIAYECGWGATFTLGRFNAPIGFELLDPNEMYQYSHSLVFTYGLPTNLTGVMLHRDLGSGLDLALYAVDGWDVNAETNRSPTLGGRLGASFGTFSPGFSVISGKETDDLGEPRRTVYDLDLSWSPAGWVVGGELNAGVVEGDGSEQQWYGGLVMVHRELTARHGLTVRYDRFDDRDGYAFGLVDGASQVRQSLTIAPTFTLDEGLGALFELRIDFSDRQAFSERDGGLTDAATTMAFEMTYGW